MKEPEMIIEIAGEEPKADEQRMNEPEEQKTEGDDGQGKAERPKDNAPSTLQRMKESASEDDDAPVGSLTLKQIVGGDYLFAVVRHHVALIMLIVLMLVIYVGVRYQCEQDVLEINQLEKDLVDAKYKAMSSSSNLTELCRQSHVLNVLRENQDTLLQISDQPPFIIEVPEE
jgi:hypothetical protein